MSSERQVIVVGGGVVGAACAYYLRRAGWAVTVLDSGGFGQGCSHANCGFVCPSHVLRLALRARRPPAPGPADGILAARAGGARRDDPRGLSRRGDRPREWTGQGGGDETGRNGGGGVRLRHGGADAAAEPASRLPHPDS